MDDGPVIPLLLSLIGAARVFFQSRTDVALEVLALRQLLAVLKRRRPRPPLRALDRLFWALLRATWPRWRDAILIVKPETVVSGHRASFRLYWRWKSRPRGGRPKLAPELRELIRRLAKENTGWGAPKIHGELQKLGFVVSERTVARYLPRTRRRDDAGKKWLAFLHNHREAIVAFDFFTVPTASFRILYCFFIIEHERRKILHFNVTRHPSAEWVVQQLRATFPEAAPYCYAILDHDSIFNHEVVSFLEATGLKPMRTSIRSPWQNGTAERWIGSCRREILDHVIPVNEEHLRRILGEYVCYHQEDRVHDSLSKDTPSRRPVEPRSTTASCLTALPRLGGLHHRYMWRQAA
jgi:hypothetical protein